MMDHPSENEALSLLIRAAREDDAFRSRLCAVLRLDDFNRGSLLRTWAYRARMEQPDAPGGFARALELLADARVAATALRLIEED